MDTLSGDLLTLLDKQLDAPTSALLGISSGIEIFMTGHEDFDYKKNVKWLVYGLTTSHCKAVYGLTKQNDHIIKFLLETHQYWTLGFMYEFYRTEYIVETFWLMNLRRRILPPAGVSSHFYQTDRFIEQTIKDHWWDGTVYIHNLIKSHWGYDHNEVRKCIAQNAYKYGYLDALQLIDFVPPESKLIGMIESDVDYGHQLFSEMYDYIGTKNTRKSSLRILLKVLGIKKDLTFFLGKFGDQLYISEAIIGLVRYITKKNDHHNMMFMCFIRAVQQSNHLVVNALYDAYNTLYQEELSKKKSEIVDKYRKIKEVMLNYSIHNSVLSVCEKYLGKEQNPTQAYYQRLPESERDKFIRSMIGHGNYSIFNI